MARVMQQQQQQRSSNGDGRSKGKTSAAVAKKDNNNSSRGGNNAITDPRFANIQTDPRFRLPSRKHAQVQLDSRFSHMLKDDDFSKKASVDKYGRRVVGGASGGGRRELERFYRIGKEEGEEADGVDEDEDVEEELRRVERKYDPAREGGFEESSSEEEEEEESSEDDDEEEVVDAAQDDLDSSATQQQQQQQQQERGAIPMGEVSSRIAVVNLDWDNIRAVDLMAVAASFCPANGKVEKVTVYPSEFGREAMEREDVEGPPRELFGALGRGGGNDDDDDDDEDRDSGFASEEREEEEDEEEETEEEEFDDDDDDEAVKSKLIKDSTAATSEVDTHALREYQMSRLRYYYAVIQCSDADTAHALYKDMDGREYLSTANFFDMRFVPDGVTFDDPITDKPRDSCTTVPQGYRPNEFVTEALTHSKVRLTWDEDDKSRKEVQKRAFSRQEVDENDLKAYIGSDSSDDEEEGDHDDDDDDNEVGGVAVNQPNAEDQTATSTSTKPLSKSEIARQKMRAALGLAPEPTRTSTTTTTTSSSKSKSKKDEPTGGMQVTFSAGLTSAPARDSVFENRPEDVKEETTMEKYVRKERERKARRKAKMKAERAGAGAAKGDEDGAGEGEGESDQDFIGEGITSTTVKKTSNKKNTNVKDVEVQEEEEEDPFNDPFFDNPASANAIAKKLSQKEKRREAHAVAAAQAERKAAERAALELLMTDDVGVGGGAGGKGGAHFDMAEIKKAEKGKNKKMMKRALRKQRKMEEEMGSAATTTSTAAAAAGQQQDFEMDVSDPRFASVFDSHEFAIDPSNPKFSGTQGMKKLLEEGRRKRRAGGGGGGAGRDEDGGDGGEDGGDVITASWLKKGDKEKKKKSGGGDKEVDELLNRVKRRRI